MVKRNYMRKFAIIVCILLCGVVFLSLSTTKAYGATETKISGWKHIPLYHWDKEDYDYRKSGSMTFKVKKKSYVRFKYEYIPVALYDTDDAIYADELEGLGIDSGKIKISIYNKKGKCVSSYVEKTKGCEVDEKYTGWFFCREKFPAGEYTMKITSSGSLEYGSYDYDISYDVYCSILGYRDYSKKASIKKKVSKQAGNWVKIGKFGPGLPYAKSIKSSKKKVVDGWWIKQNGTICVYLKKSGTATITTTLMNGKKYKTKVKSKPLEPDFYAYLYDYNTRNNYFVVKVKNVGNRKLTIIRKGAKVKDKDYKSFDRKIKGSGNVVVKPGKTKKIKFYVKGRNTWPELDDFTMHAHFKYDGKKYKWKTGTTFTWYKRGKKWVNTFWDFDEYEDWE